MTFIKALLLAHLLAWSLGAPLAPGAPGPPLDIMGGGPQAVGEHPYGPLLIPAGSRRVAVQINRAAFSKPDSEVSLTIEALMGGAWVLIKATPRTAGGVLLLNGQPHPFSLTYVTLPPDATQIRGVVSVFGSPATVPTQVFFD